MVSSIKTTHQKLPKIVYVLSTNYYTFSPPPVLLSPVLLSYALTWCNTGEFLSNAGEIISRKWVNNQLFIVYCIKCVFYVVQYPISNRIIKFCTHLSYQISPALPNLTCVTTHFLILKSQAIFLKILSVGFGLTLSVLLLL